MKFKYLLFFAATLCLRLNAQYTITSTMNPVPGDVESYKDLNPTGLIHGSSGTGQTWNYSAISISTVATTPSTYVAISSVPNNFLFPGATIGSDNGSSTFLVYSNTASKIEYMGSATATASNCILFSNPLKYYSLPFTYGTVSPDNFALSTTGFTVSGTFTTTGDGAGTLILPSGTYNNVLKLKFVVYETVNNGSSVSTYTVIESRYLSAASKFPLLTIDTQTTVTTSTTTTSSTLTTGQINANFVTGIKEAINQLSPLTIYPNPSSNGITTIHFSLQKNENCQLEVYNSIGQNVKTISFGEQTLGTITKSIDLSDLENGLYILKLKTGTNEQSSRITISR